MPEVTIEQLREIEWAGRYVDGDTWCCPKCGSPKEYDHFLEPDDELNLLAGTHDDDCWIGRLLRDDLSGS